MFIHNIMCFMHAASAIASVKDTRLLDLPNVFGKNDFHYNYYYYCTGKYRRHKACNVLIIR